MNTPQIGSIWGETEPVEVVVAELVEKAEAPDVDTVALIDPAVAVIQALNAKAMDHLERIRPRKTRVGYARDWVIWSEFHDWLAERTGTRLANSDITVGTFVAFVTYLDQVVKAPPTTIERRLIGTTSEARRRGYTVPREASEAAWRALKPLKLDNDRQERGRGKAAAATPDDLRKMANAPLERQPAPTARRQVVLRVPELARVRDQAMNSMKFAVAGRNQEMALLKDSHIQPTEKGLKVHVPSVKGRPARDVPVTYGEDRATCPVRCWKAWQEAKLAAGAAPGGPAFLSVDQWGHLGSTRLSPDAVGRGLKRCAQYAGLTGRRITGHSARRGLVTTGRQKGKRVEKLRRQGGWSANSPVFWEYVDEGEMFEDAATEGIGL